MIICIFMALLTVFIQVSALVNLSSLRFDESALKKIAETEGYGYKTGNLQELKKLVDVFNKEVHPLKVEVPDFVGIQSGQVVAALKSVNFDVLLEWKTVLATLTAADQEKNCKSKQLTEEFWIAQKTFVAKLREGFKNLEKTSKDNPFGLSDQQQIVLRKLFKDAQTDKLMVRSTGKEDTRTLANAGGNESIANVEPNMKAVLVASEEVVVSYFGKKSLKQRLGLGDETLLKEEVFCPILIQLMIGEQKGMGAPGCGVMFTEEAEGGIGCFHEDGNKSPVKTTGITMIQAAYGHNEGVVNSRVVVDTYVAQMIDNKPVFYPVIRAKRERLVPSVNGLVMTKNGPRMVTAPALSEKALITLKLFANALEDYYGYPMDVEFVVRDKTIWIVQARPITHSDARKNVKPGYLDLKKIASDKIFKGRTIGAFGGAVVQVNNQDECIISDRIGTALETYSTSGRNIIKCVFSGTDAPATSHEATTFRGEGKPVLYVSDINELRNAFVGGKKLLFSPQQHCVVVVAAAEQLVEKEGWCAYPLPRELSVVPVLFVNGGEMHEFNPEKGDLGELFKELKNEDAATVLQAAQKFPNIVADAIARKLKGVLRDADLDKQAKMLVWASQELCRRIGMLCEKNASLLERLLPINYLEALMDQNISKEMGLGYLSLDRLLGVVDQEVVVTKKEEFVDFTFKTSEERVLYTQLLRARISCFSEDARQAWGSFIKKLLSERTIEKNAGFFNIFTHYARSGILPMWLNMTFTKETNDMLVETLLNKITEEYQKDRDVLNGLAEIKKEIESLNVINFANPKHLNKEFDGFVKKYIRDGKDGHKAIFGEIFIKNFASQSATIKMYALDVMGIFVNNGFDLLIKEVRASRQFDSVQSHVEAFKKVVSEYVNMLKVWSGLFATQDIDYVKNVATMVKELENCLKEKSDNETMLDASVGFVVAVHLFSNYRVEFFSVKTVSDVFTTTHQNLLMLISWTITKFFTITMLPEVLQKINKEISLVDMSNEETCGKKIELLSVSFEKELIALRYNIPMNQHSMGMTFTYNRKNNDVTVEFRNVYMSANMSLLHDFLGVVANFSAWKNAKSEHVGSSVITFTVTLHQDQVMHALNCITDKYFLRTIFFIADNKAEMAKVDLRSIWFIEAIDKNDKLKALLVQISKNLLNANAIKLLQFVIVNLPDEVEKLAAEMIKSTNVGIQKLGVDLYAALSDKFKDLIKEGKSLDEAQKLAAEMIKSDDSNVQWVGADLYVAVGDRFKDLIKEGKSLDEAQKLAAEMIMSTYGRMKMAGVGLYIALGDRFKDLIKEGKSLDEAQKLADEMIMIKSTPYIIEKVRSAGKNLQSVLDDSKNVVR